MLSIGIEPLINGTTVRLNFSHIRLHRMLSISSMFLLSSFLEPSNQKLVYSSSAGITMLVLAALHCKQLPFLEQVEALTTFLVC